MYFRARYVDPALGTFLSPDTLVPEPGRAVDYNRFAFVRGNPLKYVDPSGHCAVNEDGSRSGDDAECWQLADAIYAMWDADAWWHDRYGVDRDYFMNTLAGMTDLDTNWMQSQLDTWFNNFAQTRGLNMGVQWNEPPDQPIAPRLTDVVTGRCEIIDCTGLVIDVVSFVGTVVMVGASPLCGPAAPGCAAVAGRSGFAISFVATGTGLIRTAVRETNGQASGIDVIVASTTSGLSFTPRIGPVVGPASSFAQIIYDFFGSSASGGQ
jgi:hypothetical protein